MLPIAALTRTHKPLGRMHTDPYYNLPGRSFFFLTVAFFFSCRDISRKLCCGGNWHLFTNHILECDGSDTKSGLPLGFVIYPTRHLIILWYYNTSLGLACFHIPAISLHNSQPSFIRSSLHQPFSVISPSIWFNTNVLPNPSPPIIVPCHSKSTSRRILTQSLFRWNAA